MVAADSLDEIAAAVDGSLGQIAYTVQVPKIKASRNAEYLHPLGSTRDASITWVEETRFRVQWSKLVGILFCPPASKVATDEVLPNLEYFHHRSGLFVDFFCAGYGPRSSSSQQDGKLVAEIGSTQWFHSSKAFNRIRADTERSLKWTFSGETDLLLAAARKPVDGLAVIDSSVAIACNLEAMLRDNAISSVRAFFERIFQFGETYKGSDPVFEFSDAMGLKVGGNALREAVLAMLPEDVRKAYKSAKHFVVRDISRDGGS